MTVLVGRGQICPNPAVSSMDLWTLLGRGKERERRTHLKKTGHGYKKTNTHRRFDKRVSVRGRKKEYIYIYIYIHTYNTYKEEEERKKTDQVKTDRETDRQKKKKKKLTWQRQLAEMKGT